MLTRRGAFRQRGLDLPKIQTDINQVEAATPSPILIHDIDSELAEFIKVDDSCLEFLTPTSGVSSSSGGTSTATATATPGRGGGDDDIPWPRPMDRDIHGRSGLKRTAPDWAIKVRLTLSKDIDDHDLRPGHHGRKDDESSHPRQRRPSVVDRRFSYGRKIQADGGRRPSDFSLRSPPPGLAAQLEDIPFELVLCSEEDSSLYSN